MSGIKAIEKIPLPNTPEGQKYRKDKIGSTDARVIMGVCPWKTLRELYNEKNGLATPKEMNPAMQRGIKLEPIARKEFEQKLGFEFPAECALHKEESWMLSSIDGWCASEKQGLEIKIPGQKDHALGMAGFVPDKYIPQLQHHISVWEIDFIHYYTWNEVSSHHFKYYRDDAYIKKMISMERDFYDSLSTPNPPEEEKQVYQEIDCFEWASLMARYKLAEQQEQIFAEEKEKLKSFILEMADEKATRGGGYILSKHERKGNIDYKKIPHLYGRNLDEFRSPPTVYWRIQQEKTPR